MPGGQSKLFVHALITQCQELDTLTVTRLRPMSDMPIIGNWLFVVYNHNLEPMQARRVSEKYIEVFNGSYKDQHCTLDEFIGYIVIPRLKPSEGMSHNDGWEG